MTSSARVLRNFVKNYGRQKLASLIRMLEEQKSGQQIAKHMGVSRERIRQWKNVFGDTVKVYIVRQEVKNCYNSRRIKDGSIPRGSESQSGN